MAIDRVAKVLVAVHQDSAPNLLKRLQRRGILHIVKTEEMEPGTDLAEMDRQFVRLEEAIEFLGSRQKKKGGVLGEAKVEMTRPDFDRAVEEYEPGEHLEHVRVLSRELEESSNRIRSLKTETARLGPWTELDYAPAGLYENETVEVVAGRFADVAEFEKARELLKDKPADVQRVGTAETEMPVLIVSAKEAAEEVSRVVGTLRFEMTDLKGVRQKPAQVVEELKRQVFELGRRRDEIETKLGEMLEVLPRLKAVADNLGNERDRTATEAGLDRTEVVTLVPGWVRERDFVKLERAVEESGAASLSRLEPEKDEEPPVALVNRTPFRPFELVLDLYSMPKPSEVDPTPLLAPFFAIFFGFCLTDAGYGIALVVIAALLMKKLGRSNKLLGMLLVGGFFTIIAGALVGGWFGDLPDKIGLAPLINFRNRLVWFDPLKNPMQFFILSLAFGYLHLMFGMVIEIVDCLRVRRVGDALLGQLPWFVALNSLVAIVLLGKSLPVWVSALLLVLVLASVASIVVFTQRATGIALAQTMWFGMFWLVLVFFAAKLGRLPAVFLHVKWLLLVVFAGAFAYTLVNLARTKKLKPVALAIGGAGVVCFGLYLSGVLPWFVAGLAGLAFFFTAPANRQVAGKLAWGGYALYGATSYVGVVLSYIRIMALGMVTGGIAMAVNTVAWMVTGIPVLGIIIALVVLAIGHTYNLAVNVLGAFVHTLRLNYVEFFPRFYTGGGEPFKAFKEQNRFVAVK